MSVNKVLVHTQYEENYGFNEGNYHWKKKGGHTFQIEMDVDLLMYSDAEKVFGEMLGLHCNDYERFTYAGFEIQWKEPTVLGNQEDYIMTNQELNSETV